MAEQRAPHNHGTVSLLPSVTPIAVFPVGTFLENIAVRSNGTILVSSMTGGDIFYLDPNAPDPQSTLLKIHDFNISTSSPIPSESEEEASPYGSGQNAEAIVEDPNTPDIFYTFAGQHGKTGTWAVFKFDLTSFDSSASPLPIPMQKIADIPHATWLNGATMLPQNSTLLIAESKEGQLVSCNTKTGEVGIWLEHELLGKKTTRAPYPAVNGVQYFRNQIFATNSDRGIIVKLDIVDSGNYVRDSLEAVAENVVGDDLAFDADGTLYNATNPMQTILKFPGIGLSGKDEGRVTIVGGEDVALTQGPTGVAFGRTEGDKTSVYITTTGGLVVPVGEGPGVARVVRVNVGVQGEP
jgi:hypothetical protein